MCRFLDYFAVLMLTKSGVINRKLRFCRNDNVQIENRITSIDRSQTINIDSRL